MKTKDLLNVLSKLESIKEESENQKVREFKKFVEELENIKHNIENRKTREFRKFIETLKEITLRESKRYFDSLKNIPADYGFTGVNIFEVLGIRNAEDPISYFLSWLLDPNGSHGLDKKFLEKFMQLCKEVYKYQGELQLENVEIKPQKEFSGFNKEKGGALDIEIFSKRNFLCIVENKLGAGFTEGQLKKYSRYTKKRGEELGVDSKRVFCIALDPKTKPLPRVNHKFKKMDYNSIIKLLKELKKGLPSQGTLSTLISQFLLCARVHKGNQNIFQELNEISELTDKIKECKKDSERNEILANEYLKLKTLNSRLKQKEVI